MIRWNHTTGKPEENAKVDAFIYELLEVSRKHGLSLKHEEHSNELIVAPHSVDAALWLEEVPYVEA